MEGDAAKQRTTHQRPEHILFSHAKVRPPISPAGNVDDWYVGVVKFVLSGGSALWSTACSPIPDPDLL